MSITQHEPRPSVCTSGMGEAGKILRALRLSVYRSLLVTLVKSASPKFAKIRMNVADVPRVEASSGRSKGSGIYVIRRNALSHGVVTAGEQKPGTHRDSDSSSQLGGILKPDGMALPNSGCARKVFLLPAFLFGEKEKQVNIFPDMEDYLLVKVQFKRRI